MLILMHVSMITLFITESLLMHNLVQLVVLQGGKIQIRKVINLTLAFFFIFLYKT